MVSIIALSFVSTIKHYNFMNAATIILQQLGGNRFLAMTGSKNVFSTDNGMTLTMHLTPNKAKAKYLRITLTEMDTYNMVFQKNGTKKDTELFPVVAQHENVYAEMLQSIFTEVTGLYTRL